MPHDFLSRGLFLTVAYSATNRSTCFWRAGPPVRYSVSKRASSLAKAPDFRSAGRLDTPLCTTASTVLVTM
jgi:hypothetical protein